MNLLNNRNLLSPVIDLGDKKIMVVTDIHLKAGVENDSGAPGAIDVPLSRYYYSSFDLLETFVTNVNIVKPDLVLCLGDMCDLPEAFTRFNQIWGAIDSSVPSYVIPGNHDLDDLTYSELLDALDMTGAPIVAGSEFNKTFSLGTNTRIILTDTTFNNVDVHVNGYTNMHMHSTTPAWIQSILENTTENNVVIAAHCAPVLSEFNGTQGAAILAIVDAAKVLRPDLNVTWICGHRHFEALYEDFSNANSPTLIIPALILYENGRYAELDINQVTEDITYKQTFIDYSLGTPVLPFQMTIDTTLGDGLAEFTFPFSISGTIKEYDMVIDWPDGTQSFSHGAAPGIQGSVVKSFSSGGVKLIQAQGTMSSLYFNNGVGDGKDYLKLTAINQWGHVKQSTNERMLYGCTNLTLIPGGPITGCEESITLNLFMRGCSGITGMFDADFLSLLPLITAVSNAFDGMTGLSGKIPNEFFKENILLENFYRTWYGCTGINEIGLDIYRYCVLATTFQEAHRNNTGLNQPLPEDLFYYNPLVINYRGVFHSIPSLPLPTRIWNTANLNIVTVWDDFMRAVNTGASGTGTIQEIWNVVYDAPPTTLNAFLNQINYTNYAAIPAGWK